MKNRKPPKEKKGQTVKNRKPPKEKKGQTVKNSKPPKEKKGVSTEDLADIVFKYNRLGPLTSPTPEDALKAKMFKEMFMKHLRPSDRGDEAYPATEKDKP